MDEPRQIHGFPEGGPRSLKERFLHRIGTIRNALHNLRMLSVTSPNGDLIGSSQYKMVESRMKACATTIREMVPMPPVVVDWGRMPFVGNRAVYLDGKLYVLAEGDPLMGWEPSVIVVDKAAIRQFDEIVDVPPTTATLDTPINPRD